jgi:6-phosphogluconolactonase
MRPIVLVDPTPDESARAAAVRLRLLLVESQRRHGTAAAALSGGSAALAPLSAPALRRGAADLDPRLLDLWWADERHVPGEHPHRNDTAAIAALGELCPPPDRLHRVAGTDVSLEQAAADYDCAFSTWVAACVGTGRPPLDVALLGVGPDGHVASLFPGRPEADATAFAVAVADAPKPPPARVSLTLRALELADEVWLLANGRAKAPAVAAAVAGDPSLPAGRVRGRLRTRWFLDADAAADLSPGVIADQPEP